jgi:hypothetical protein
VATETGPASSGSGRTDAHPCAAIDWSAAWLAPWRAVGEPLGRALSRSEAPDVATALQRVLDAWHDGRPPAGLEGPPPRLPAGPLRFVPGDAAPPGEAYEAFIARTARVPTRDGLHDFFNGLVWLHLPALKAAMNAAQAAEIGRRGTRGPRGPLRDALTLFDENGAWLVAPPSAVADLRARRWTRLLAGSAPSWGGARLVLVGHALMEQLVQPRKPLCAHVWCLDEAGEAALRAGRVRPGPSGGDPDTGPAGDADHPPGPAPACVDRPADRGLHWLPRDFLPLPVLGVPGWWPPNREPGFHDDVSVFRPPRPPDARRGHTAPLNPADMPPSDPVVPIPSEDRP